MEATSPAARPTREPVNGTALWALFGRARPYFRGQVAPTNVLGVIEWDMLGQLVKLPDGRVLPRELAGDCLLAAPHPNVALSMLIEVGDRGELFRRGVSLRSLDSASISDATTRAVPLDFLARQFAIVVSQTIAWQVSSPNGGLRRIDLGLPDPDAGRRLAAQAGLAPSRRRSRQPPAAELRALVSSRGKAGAAKALQERGVPRSTAHRWLQEIVV